VTQDRTLSGPLSEVAEPGPEGRADSPALAGQPSDGRPAEPVHLSVLAHAGSSPDAVAVICGETRLTYGQFRRRAEDLAARLGLGRRPREPIVAVQLARCVELEIALIATMRAGGVYLPLDPDQPLLRRQAILTDARPEAVVTSGRWLTGLEALTARRVCLDQPAPPPSRPGGWPAVVNGDQLAYAIYTSGSTGQPKGALNTHRGIANLLWRFQEQYHLGPDDALLCHTPASFDVSVLEMLWPLLAGGTAVLARPGWHADPGHLADLIERHRITAIIMVPAVLASFLDLPDVGRRCVSLRVIVCGGEALTPRLRDRCLDALPGARLDNCYGPAEAAVGATTWECRPDDRAHSIPIGKPIAFNRAYVCDADRRLMPASVTGELCLSGDNVGRGYLGRPDLTADRYVPDPFSGVPGERMYRTGDLARVGASGALEFVGRLDRQVKVRGVRLELEEIEAVLGAHPGVREVAVVVRPTSRGDDQLVAYVTPHSHGESASLTRDLRALARNRLPEAAVPGGFALLEKMPRTAHGKPDLSALPDMASERTAGAGGLPRTRLELELARIWERVIGTHPIGIRDDFFDLGGHSLLAVRLLSAVADRLGVRLPGESILTHRTVADQAALLSISSVRLSGDLPPCLIRMDDGTAGQPLFIVHPMGGSAFCYVELSRALARNAPIYCIQAAGLAMNQPPHQTVPEMASAYLEQARKLCHEGPWRLAGWSFGGLVAYEMASQLAAAHDEIGMLALIDPSPVLGDAELVADDATDDLAVMEALLEFTGRLAGRDLLQDRDVLAATPRDRRRAEVVSRMRRAAGIGPSGSDEVEKMVDVFAANWRAYHRYRPAPYRGRVTLLAANGASAGLGQWKSLCPSGLRVITMPCGHFDLISPPNVSDVVAALAPDLGSHQGNGRPDSERRALG
jgi:amino acid adenylation domain-containing protein